MRFLKQNTATRVTVGPFMDKTDGITPETTLTVTNCKLTLCVDDGGVPTLVLDAAATASAGNNDMVHITNDDAGFYDLELTAAQTNYVGRAILSITDAANHCPVFHEFMILPANVFDSLMGTDKLDVNTAEVSGTTQTARDLGASVLLSSGTGTGQVSLSSGTVTVGTNNDKTGYTASTVSDKTGYALSSAGVQALWDALTSALTAVGSIGKLLTDNINATVSSRLASASYVSPLDAAGTRAAVGMAAADLDAQLAAITSDIGDTQTALGVIDDYVDTEVAAIKAKTDLIPAAPAAVGDIPSAATIAAAVGTRTPATETYAADGVIPSYDQFLFMLWSCLSQFAIAGTTISTKKLDGATQAMTFTLDDASTPTSRNRAS